MRIKVWNAQLVTGIFFNLNKIAQWERERKKRGFEKGLNIYVIKFPEQEKWFAKLYFAWVEKVHKKTFLNQILKEKKLWKKILKYFWQKNQEKFGKSHFSWFHKN